MKNFIIIILFICNIAFADEQLAEFSENTLPVFNETMQKLRSDVDTPDKNVCWIGFESDTSVSTGNGTSALVVSSSLTGMNLVNVTASVHTKGVTGTTDVQIRRRRAGSDDDMLTTKVTIGDEYYVSDEVIDTTNDDIEVGDQIYIDVDAIHSGTAPKGLSVTCTFRKKI